MSEQHAPLPDIGINGQMISADEARLDDRPHLAEAVSPDDPQAMEDVHDGDEVDDNERA